MPNTISGKRQLIQTSTQSLLGEVGANRNQSISIPSSLLVQALNRIPIEVDETSSEELDATAAETTDRADIDDAISALAEQIGLEMINDFNQTPPPVLQQLQSELAQTPTLGVAPQFNPRAALTQRVGRDIMSGISEQGDINDDPAIDIDPDTINASERPETDGTESGTAATGESSNTVPTTPEARTKPKGRSRQNTSPAANNQEANRTDTGDIDAPTPPPPLTNGQPTSAATAGKAAATTGSSPETNSEDEAQSDDTTEAHQREATTKSRSINANQIKRYPEIAKLDARAKKIKVKLEHDIKSGKFEGFMGALVLAIIADILGLFTLGWGGTIVAFLVNLGIYAILASEGSHFKAVAKKNRVAQVAQFVAEYIPYLNIAPLWTSAILVYRYLSNRSISKKLRGIKRLEKVEKKIRRLRLMRIRPPRRSVAALHKELDVINLIAHEV